MEKAFVRTCSSIPGRSDGVTAAWSDACPRVHFGCLFRSFHFLSRCDGATMSTAPDALRKKFGIAIVTLPRRTNPCEMRVSRAAKGRRERETDEANKVHGRADCGHPEAERSRPETAELCRQNGISEATFYNWKAKYGGMAVSDVQKLKRLEEENAKLKRVVADLTLDNVVLKDLLSKNF